jgi:hypothetical protein
LKERQSCCRRALFYMTVAAVTSCQHSAMCVGG